MKKWWWIPVMGILVVQMIFIVGLISTRSSLNHEIAQRGKDNTKLIVQNCKKGRQAISLLKDLVDLSTTPSKTPFPTEAFSRIQDPAVTEVLTALLEDGKKSTQALRDKGADIKLSDCSRK